MIKNSYDNDTKMMICNQRILSVCSYSKIHAGKLLFQCLLACRYSSFYD
jgi:hypothetical protein